MSLSKIKAVQLPPEKNYLAYIMYSTKSQPDCKAAYDIASVLESTHGQRCCMQERDFIPGMAIVDNIDDSLQRSFKIVILLSKASLNSPWLEFELNVALHLFLEKDKGLKQQIIPVKLDECETPNKIAFLFPINAMNVARDRWMSKLVQAVSCVDGLDSLYNMGVPVVYSREEHAQQHDSLGSSEMSNSLEMSSSSEMSEDKLCSVGTILFDKGGDNEGVKCFRVGSDYVVTTATAAEKSVAGSSRRLKGIVEFPKKNSTGETKQFHLKSLKFLDVDLGIAVLKLDTPFHRNLPEKLRLSPSDTSIVNGDDSPSIICQTSEMLSPPGSPCMFDQYSSVLAMTLGPLAVDSSSQRSISRESGAGDWCVTAVKIVALKSALQMSDRQLYKKLFLK